MPDNPRYAVFGQPITHSLSPRIHAMFGAELDIALDYRAIEAGRGDFAHALEVFARDGGRGANVTLPLKEDALQLCAHLSARARRCGSVNTLIRNGKDWHGDSTDGSGLLRDLRDRQSFEPEDRRCLVLGAGGAARAVAFALADSGVARLVIANRTRERADALAGAIGAPPSVGTIGWNEVDDAGTFDLVVHATAAGHENAAFELSHAIIAPHTLCYDLSYGRAASAFLAFAMAAGATRLCDGLGMLVEQAAESFALWHGRAPDTKPVYAALSRMLSVPAEG